MLEVICFAIIATAIIMGLISLAGYCYGFKDGQEKNNVKS